VNAFFGSQRLTSQVIALEKAGTLVEGKLTASDRLARVQQIIDGELEYAARKRRRVTASGSRCCYPCSVHQEVSRFSAHDFVC
jgi:hypothetical protein